MMCDIKKVSKYFRILLVFMFLTGCVHKNDEQMVSQETDEYYCIIWQKREYIPFGVIDNEYMGEQIGIVDEDENNQVYEVKGYSKEEWLISYYHSGEMDGCMLMKEKHLTNIPKELKKAAFAAL